MIDQLTALLLLYGTMNLNFSNYYFPRKRINGLLINHIDTYQ